jgi:hypothetical protein
VTGAEEIDVVGFEFVEDVGLGVVVEVLNQCRGNSM